MSYLGQGLGLGREERFLATASAGQTVFVMDDANRLIGYTPHYVDVYLNGVKMVNGVDVIVSSGDTVVFASALSAGDIVDIVAPGYFQPADTVSRSLGGTFLGPVNFPSGGLNVGSGQLQVDSSGRVKMGNQPGFYAYRTGAAFGSGVGIFNATRFNRGSNYDTATGRFTAPVAGTYIFTAQALPNSTTGAQLFSIQKNGVTYSASTYVINADESIGMAVVMDMAVNDYATVYFQGDGSEVSYCHFSGAFLG